MMRRLFALALLACLVCAERCQGRPAVTLSSVPPGATVSRLDGTREGAAKPIDGVQWASGRWRVGWGAGESIEFTLGERSGRLFIERGAVNGGDLALSDLPAVWQPWDVSAVPDAELWVPESAVDGRPGWERQQLDARPTALTNGPRCYRVRVDERGRCRLWAGWTEVWLTRPRFAPCKVAPTVGQPLEARFSPLYGPFSYLAFDVALVLALVGGAGWAVRRWRAARVEAANDRVEAEQAREAAERARQVVEEARESASRDTGHTVTGAQGSRYLLLTEIGSGGMGTVYRAQRLDDDLVCAVKRMRADAATTSEARQRFLREIQICGGIQHSGLVRVFDWGEDGSDPFMVCELVDGETLRARMSPGAPTATAEALRCTIDVLRALRVVHAHGIIHRDLKPENIMVTTAGVVKVMDFGIAGRLDRHSLTQTATTMGTPQYMSPEHLDARSTSAASDIFSMGVILYEMLTGRLPFEADDIFQLITRMITEDAPALAEARPDLPAALCDAVDRMRAGDQGDRYASVDELLPVLEALLAQV
ncbi:MAG: serine/threonine protein kinase [Proteobacteria bacterium]|nr:serine/threonine protein kinase [Pseudomonadota bacterium]